jgi:phage replication O-like protein O
MAIESPNYTQIPNEIIDAWMNQLSGVEFKILMSICRKTFGWGKDKDRISFSQFEKITGASRQAVSEAIKKLSDLDLIDPIKQHKKTTVYSVRVVRKSYQTGTEIIPDEAKTGMIIIPTKERIKETNKRKGARRVLPSSLQEVKDYVKTKGLSIDPDFFYKYFTESDWIDSSGNPVQNWKQKALTWGSYAAKTTKTKKSIYPEI